MTFAVTSAMKRSSLLLLLSAFAVAADVVAEAQAALTGDDVAAKREALRALATKDAGDDGAAIPVLLAALNDRQVGEDAARTLAQRTGASPKGGVWMIGREEPVRKAWAAWWAEEQTRRKVGDLDKKIKDAARKAEKPAEDAAAPAAAEAKPEARPARPAAVPDDLGKLDRIFLKSGGSLLCYIRSRRTDAEGNLLSVRIYHPDGGGEETLAAALISRIEEDVR